MQKNFIMASNISEPLITPSSSNSSGFNLSKIIALSTGEGDLAYKAILIIALFFLVYVHFSTATPSQKTPRPVVVPSWIPWLGSALTMGLDPDGFVIRNA